MSEKFLVPAFEVPVKLKTDVCIIGAGPAGVAAAIAASRLHLSVLLIEKYGFCGGATVAGLSGTICGLFTSGDSPRQLVFGFADEFYRALKDRHGVSDPVRFGKTLLVPHDALSWKMTADAFLSNTGCRILFHTHFLKAYTGPGGRITALLLKGPEGPFAVEPRFVIDASGDAEVIHSIAGNTTLGKDGQVQTPTMIFKMANVDMSTFLSMDIAEINTRVADAHRSGDYCLPRHHVYLFPLPHTGEVLCNMTRITYPDGTVPLGTNATDMTFAEIEGRIQAFEYARFLTGRVPAFRNAHLSDTGTQIGIRQTRSIVGIGRLLNDDVLKAKKSPDAITLSAWPIELHRTDRVQIEYLENDHYDIPLQTLIPGQAANYMVAGRCMSAEHEALASARVTAQCFGMGYAAGAAAGLALKEKVKASQMTGAMVRQWINDNKLKNSDEK